MKNTVRANSINGTKRQSPQVKTPNEFALPEDAHPSCLAIYCRMGKAPVSKIPLSEDEFYEVLTAPRDKPFFKGMEPEQIISEAIREKLVQIVLYDHIDKLENTYLRVNALLEFLVDKLKRINTIDSDVFELEDGDKFVSGVDLLVQDAQTALSQSFTDIFNAAHINRVLHTANLKPEVAS